jgi:O-antigen/teichoic acid export membrane protein
MQRKFLTSLLLLMTLNLLVKPAYIFGIDLRVQNLVGPDEYGMFFAMFNFSMLFNMILDVGITNYNNRNISQYRHLLHKHFSGIVTIRLLLAVIYAVITLATGLVAGYGPRQMNLLGILVFNQFLIAMILYLRSNIAGLQLFKTDSLISVLDRLVMIILGGFILYQSRYSEHFRVEHFAWLQTLSYLCAATAAAFVVVRKAAFRRLYWNRLFMLMVIRRSFPYALLVLLMMFYFRVDSVLLERILPEGIGARQAGIYASAFRLLDALVMVPYLFSVLLLPMFARMLKLREDFKEIIRIAFPLLLVFSFVAVSVSISYSEEIMQLLYREHAEASARVFRFLMPGLIAFSVSYVFSTLLTANGNLRTLNIIAGSAMALNIILNIMLIPRYQAAGSAFASCATLTLAALLHLLVTMRDFSITPSATDLLRFAGFCLAIALILTGGRYLPLGWVIQMGISAFAMVIASLMLRMIRPKELWMIIRKQTSGKAVL